MEEPLWLIFGIIIILVAIGVIAGIVSHHGKIQGEEAFFDGLQKLKVECDFICSATEGNLLSIPLDVPPNSKLYTNEKRICLQIENRTECERCGCTLEKYELNLANISIGKRFQKHTYNCFFERLKDTVRMECIG
jgi:hypothetical protein